MRPFRWFVPLALLAALAPCGPFGALANAGEGIGIVPCEPVGDMQPHCGFRNPEDLVSIPGTSILVVSEMGDMLDPSREGTLSTFDVETGTRTELAVSWTPDGDRWGDPACAPPPHLNPHGIDLRVRPDARRELLVVNHGGRESVEMFELDDAGGVWRARWRGCVIPPGEPLLNDVTALPGGGFAVTHMWDRDRSTAGMIFRFLLGMDTGWVWAWTPVGGFEKLEGTDATMPNGIASSPDGRFLYVDLYLEDRVVRYDRETRQITGEVEVSQPDNVVLGPDGRLWVAGHHHFVGDTECSDIEGACPWKYSVTVIDPESMVGDVVLVHEGAPMGFATVALPVGDALFLGSALGDRIVRMPRP